MKQYLLNCNDMQRKAIMHESGPVMCLAGPGSGKTFTLTHHIKYLIEELNVEASQILVITFSKAASIEMRNRFYSIMDSQFYPVSFGTFHAVFFQMLCEQQHYSVKNILNLKQKKQYLKYAVEAVNPHFQLDEEIMEQLLLQISYIKNRGFNYNYKDDHQFKFSYEDLDFKTLIQKYQEILTENRMMDFDDMILLCLDMLKNNLSVLHYYQGKFKHILIDEYQDINPVQYEIIRMLIKPHKNLFVVGDDDQSIYGFRGCEPSIMLHFKDDFPNGEVISFPYNYRSNKSIVEAAKLLISENSKRYNKTYQAFQNIEEINDGLHLIGFETVDEEQNYIISELKRLLSKESLSNTAILLRTNHDASFWAELLMKEKIPYQMKERISNVYESFICRDLIAYLNLSRGSNQVSDLVIIMNRPLRYLSRVSFNNSIFTFRELYQLYREKNYAIKNLKKLEYDLKWLSKMDFYAAINYIRKGMGYDEFLRKTALEQNIPFEKWQETLNDLHKRIGTFENLDQLKIHIEEYTHSLKNMTKNIPKEAVHIMTFHSSKGLEFEEVLIPDCNEGYIPHKKSSTCQDIEEERRLFYVAMTRAKRVLKLCYIKESRNQEHLVSRFIKCLIKKYK